MARLPRLVLAGLPHYVMQTSVHGQRLALDDADLRVLLTALHDAAARHRVGVWGYSVLPQALHLVLCPATSYGLGHMMQMLGRRYVPVFNRRHQRSGALWAGRYGAAVVEPGPWVVAALVHVERLGMAAGARGAWSSASHHLGRCRDPNLTEPPEFWALGNTPFERESAWRARLADELDAATEAMLDHAVRGGWAAGSATFAAWATEAAGRPAAPRPAGRPRRLVRD